MKPIAVTPVNINADLGEGSGNDAAIMPFLHSCSIACGGHFGTARTMQQTVRLAKSKGVLVGAHPSFPDTVNFGRKLLTITKAALSASILGQLLDFYNVCKTENCRVHHIKMHGALYNFSAKDAPTASAIVAAILKSGKRPVLYVPHNSILHKKAENLLPLAFEGFIDRRYNDNGALVSRSLPNAVIKDPRAAWAQLHQMLTKNSVTAHNGSVISLKANTFCIHGDHPDPVGILTYIYNKLNHFKP